MAKRVAMVDAIVVVEVVGISHRICFRICLSSSISLSRPLTIVIMSSVATIIGIAVVVVAVAETIASIPMATISNMAEIVETMVAIANAIEAVFGGRCLGFRCGLRLSKGKTNGQKAESGDCLMD